MVKEELSQRIETNYQSFDKKMQQTHEDLLVTKDLQESLTKSQTTFEESMTTEIDRIDQRISNNEKKKKKKEPEVKTEKPEDIKQQIVD